MNAEREYNWHIVKRETETHNVASFHLVCPGMHPQFRAGQYLTVRLPDLEPREGKSYSITNTPDEDGIRITVKKMGAFSSALYTLDVGDMLTTSAPYGFFYPESDESTPLVFIAGGIGIAPCISIVTNLKHTKDTRPIRLYYSNQTEADIVFLEELYTLTKTHPDFRAYFFITREIPHTPSFHKGRATTEHILETLAELGDPEFFICGSIQFTQFYFKTLKSAGIAEHQIYTEGFF